MGFILMVHLEEGARHEHRSARRIAVRRLRHRRRPPEPLHTLASLLTLSAVAMLCGCRSLYAIAQWGRDYNHLAPLLGFTRPAKGRAGYRTPCVSELHTVFAA